MNRYKKIVRKVFDMKFMICLTWNVTLSL